MEKLTHIDKQGNARMVNVGEKMPTERIAEAVGYVLINKETLEIIIKGQNKKGEVLGTARIAGIMAAKRTSDIIPMCHSLLLTGVDIDFEMSELADNQGKIKITSRVTCSGKTGVEMEALTAVSVAALTIYDMCKAVQRDICIENIHLLKKSGGKSGEFIYSAL
ncbi:cyclic pyranopterin monophosphate synthase MoaC [Aminipila terrae]|uniref:Cyclic pyranopterin monophosphate synthase n=1 Tax=Aminipila terrae TaxID=2697030 RepID=A0A6P1MC77_9FIRM|nr:cyclic pyranopterin monophosphate synthase MoaC [Aminipila terrae]QHI72309.1 cyclic pyranopterin monophosphate synthase MoaC [Aminipila terrae]